MRIHLKTKYKQMVSEHSDYFFNYFTMGIVSLTVCMYTCIYVHTSFPVCVCVCVWVGVGMGVHVHILLLISIQLSFPPVCRMCCLMQSRTLSRSLSYTQTIPDITTSACEMGNCGVS